MGTGFEFIRDGDWERPEVGGISTSFCLLSPCRSGELLYPVKNSSKICFSFILLFPKDFKSGGSQEDAHMALSLLGRFPLKYLYTFLRRDTSWRVLRDALGKYFLTYWTFPSLYGKLYLDLIIYTANEARFVRKIRLKRILTRAKEEEEEKLLVRRDRNFDPWITNRPRLKRYKDTLLSNEKEIIVNAENT